MGEMAWVTSPEGEVFIRRSDVLRALRAMGDDLLTHIPGHADAGEFLEALQDRWAASALHNAADFLESIEPPKD